MVRSRDSDSQTRRCRVEHDIRSSTDERCPIRALKLKMTARGHIYYVSRLFSCKVGCTLEEMFIPKFVIRGSIHTFCHRRDMEPDIANHNFHPMSTKGVVED